MKKVKKPNPCKAAFRAVPLAAAIGAAMSAGITSTAHAVNISGDGLGEVLLFPYYTTNNEFDTYINITNTSENAVVFKIRFREAYNSRDARDFNVVLSPYDVWTATITENPDGTAARLITADTSCTAGQLPIDLGGGRRAIDFTNFDYIDGAGGNDEGPTTLARTKEGYIEVIEMGHQRPTVSGLPSPDLTFAAGSVGHNSQHVNGVPRNCNLVRTAFTLANIGATALTFFEPINVLKGSASLVKVDEGKATGFEPTVLANFFNPDVVTGEDNAGLIGDNLFYTPEDTNPQLSQVFPATAVVPHDNAADVIIDDFLPATADAVTAVLSRPTVVNQYSVNPANNAATDWVVTFPTKYYYVDERQAAVAVDTPLAPFNNGTTFQEGNGCAEVEVGFRFFDREEDERVDVSSVGFSPPPPGVSPDAICYEAQVLTFANSDVLGSPLSANVPVDAAGFNNGWMSLVFTQAGTITGVGGTTFTGLPVIGFGITTLENGVSGDNLLNYGMSSGHGYTRNIGP